MKESLPERRMASNEAIFREFNENVQKGIEKANAIAAEEGVAPLDLDEDAPLLFYCECSDNNCRKRIKISPKEYKGVHKRRDAFTIVPGHNVPKIEDITKTTPEYMVVAKHEPPPRSGDALHDTDINNV
jgi:hypothetical protein